jgi:large subunit ribosomal protein L19
MSILIEKVEGQKRTEPLAPFNIGDTVKVHQKIREGDKERVQVFQGTVIARTGTGAGETFTVRKISFGVGVERVYPVNSPNIVTVEVVRHGRVRRARLYYLRDRVGKRAKVREKRRTVSE